MKKRLLAPLLLAVLALALVGFTWQRAPRVVWEYKISRVMPEIEGRSMNEAGADGWEVFAVVPSQDYAYKTFYMKRAQR